MKTKVILLLLVVFMFNGMRDARELNELSILSAVGVDIDENGEYIITSQVLNTQKSGDSSGGSGGSSVVVYETKRKSIHEALRDTIEKVPNKLYIAHLELLLISEEAAKNNDIMDTIDFFLRDNEGGNNFMIVIAKDDKPQEILSKLSAISSDPAKSITESIESTYEYEAASTDYLLYDTLDMILNNRRTIVMASISLDKHEDDSQSDTKEDTKENESTSQSSTSGSSVKSSSESSSGDDSEKEAASNMFKVTELAYFKDDRLEGYLEKSDAKIYNFLQNRLKSSVMSIDEEEDLIVVEIKEANSKLTPRFEDDHFVIDIDLKIEGAITETGKNVRDNISERFEEYVQKLEDIMKGKIEDAIDNYKNKYEEDIVGFEDLIYKKLNSKYKEIEDDFKDKYFKSIVVNVNVELKLPQQGGDMVDATK